MAVKRSDAIVIGYYPLGETDRIVVFFTKDYGKIRAVAKGVRRLKSRLCGRVEILTHGDLIFFERTGKDLHSINTFDIIETFQTLREDLLKMAYCSYMAELIQQVTSDSQSDTDIFDLMLNTMSAMKESDVPEMLVRVFEIRLLEKIGLNPRLDSCIVCSGGINDENPRFSVRAGGVLCDKCSKSGHYSVVISRDTLDLMRRIREIPFELITVLETTEANKQEMKRLLSGFISFHVDVKNLRSLRFLESIESEYRGDMKVANESDK
jgi:DNA repair protein RecO (recombination protein O)